MPPPPPPRQAPILIITSVTCCIIGVTPRLTKMTHLSQMHITGYTHFCLISLTVLFSQGVKGLETLGSRLLLFTWRSGVVEFVKEVQKYFLTPLEICTHQTECISWHLTDQTSMKVSGHSKLCKCFCFQLSCTRFCLPE